MITVGDAVYNSDENIFGKVIKIYKPTGRTLTAMIELADGRKYYAPIENFTKIQ